MPSTFINSGTALALVGGLAACEMYLGGKSAAAQYALIRGDGFARHVRTNVEESDGLWRGDAVYTVSAALSRELLTLDAEVAVDNCKDDGIPTV